MRLVKDEGAARGDREEYYFPHDLYTKIIHALVSSVSGDEIRLEFAQKYVNSYDDLRYNAFSVLA